MKFENLISYVLILSSCVLWPTSVLSRFSVEVSVKFYFKDGRSVTSACLAYHSNAPAEFLALTFPNTNPSYLLWTIPHFQGDTLNQCHMVWTNEHSELIGSMFVAYSGFDVDNRPSVFEPSTGKTKYLWLVNDNGLSLYDHAAGGYYLVKPLSSLQCIKVNVINLLTGNTQAVSILCMSVEASGRSEIISLGSTSHGESVGWTIPDFRRGTTQVCTVQFGVGALRPAFVFEAFKGSWNHDDAIWDVRARRRIYDWVLRDNGLFLKNFVTGAEVLHRNYD